jgi:hypothetical protein
MAQNAEYEAWEAAKRSMIASGGSVVVGTEVVEVLQYSAGAWHLGHVPVSPVAVFCNGQRFTEGGDYTLEGQRVVPIGVWSGGATVIAEYRY